MPGLPPCRLLAASTISAAISVTGRLFLWGTDPALNPNTPVEVLEPQPQPPIPAAPMFEFEHELSTPFKFGPAEVDGECASPIARLGAAGEGAAGASDSAQVSRSQPSGAPAAPGALVQPPAGNSALQADEVTPAAGSGLVSAPTAEALASFEASMAHLNGTPSATMVMFGIDSPHPSPGPAPTAAAVGTAAPRAPPAASVPEAAVAQPWLPQQVSWLRPHRVRQVALGPTHAVVATEDGGVYAWGRLQQGLGAHLVAGSVPLLASDEDVVAASAALGPGDVAGTAAAVSGGAPGVDRRVLGASLQQLAAQEGCGAVLLYLPVPLEAPSDPQQSQQPAVVVPLLHELWARQQLQRQQQAEQEARRQQESRGRQRRLATPPNAPNTASQLAPQLRVSFHYFNDTVTLTIVETGPMTITGQDLQGGMRSAGSAASAAAGPATQKSDATIPSPASLTSAAKKAVLGRTAGGAGTVAGGKGAAGARAVEASGGPSPTPPSPAPSPVPWGLEQQPSEEQAQDFDFECFADSCQQLPLGQEPACLLSAGVGHTVMLCAGSTYQPRPGALRRIALLLLSQVAWQYNVQRQATDGSTAAKPAATTGTASDEGTGAGAAAGGGGLAAESSAVSVWGEQAVAVTAATAATVPAALLALPDAAQTGMPWASVLLGQQLCTLLCRQASGRIKY